MTFKTVGIIIQARLSSKRFPSKVLAVPSHSDLSIIEIGYQRLSKSKYSNNLIYAIPDNEPELASFLASKNISFFTGHPTDLMSRYLDCATAFDFDIIVRITSDCPLVDPLLLDNFLDIYIHNYIPGSSSLYLSNYTPPEKSTYCNGSDIEIFDYNSLRSYYSTNPSPLYKEHVTFQFWDGTVPVRHLHMQYQDRFDLSKMRITIDYEDDLDMLSCLASKLDLINANFDSIVHAYFDMGLYTINGSHGSRDGWT